MAISTVAIYPLIFLFACSLIIFYHYLTQTYLLTTHADAYDFTYFYTTDVTLNVTQTLRNTPTLKVIKLENVTQIC